MNAICIHLCSTYFLSKIHFLESLRNYKCLTAFKFVSLNIENLFPSITLNTVIDMAAELLLNKFGTISKDEIKKLLRFCREDVSFQFGNVFYKHKNGVTMGSSLAPILAEIYLSNFENKNIFIDIPLKKFVYYRYVDDIFMIILSDISEKVCLNYLNSLDTF